MEKAKIDLKKLKFRKAKSNDLNAIMDLYADVIKNCFTTWGDGYPSEELIARDIADNNMFVLTDSENVIAVSFLGINDDDEENWKKKIHSPLGVARICVNPKYQGNGIGCHFLTLLTREAKNRGADGMRFHVCTENISAMKMYEKAGFENTGKGNSNYGFDYYRYEQTIDKLLNNDDEIV